MVKDLLVSVGRRRRRRGAKVLAVRDALREKGETCSGEVALATMIERG